MMIETWRKEWQIGDFHWTQLADFGKNRDKNGNGAWAEIRESMTIAFQNTNNTGQAIITDLGEDSNIHPRKTRSSSTSRTMGLGKLWL